MSESPVDSLRLHRRLLGRDNKSTKAQAIKQGLAIALREKGELIAYKQNGNEVQREFTFQSSLQRDGRSGT
jgi:hypothetical protein